MCPLRGLMVDGRPRMGSVRGHVGRPGPASSTWLKTAEDARFRFSQATGTAPPRSCATWPRGEPYSSTVDWSAAASGEDVASYLLHSSNPSALFVGASQDDNSGVRCCGGVLVQWLPKAASEPRLVALLGGALPGDHRLSARRLVAA